MIILTLRMVFFEKAPPEVATKKQAAEPLAPISGIFRQGTFYLLAIGSMCSIGAVGGTNQHLKLYLSRDQNYGQGEAANIISLILAFSIAGRLLMGKISEHWPKKYVMLLIYL